MLEDLGRRSILSDYPMIDRARISYSVSGSKLDEIPETPRFNQEDAESVLNAGYRQFQPFSDAFVSSIIERAMWLQQNLADQVLECWEELRTQTDTAIASGVKSTKLTKLRQDIISEFPWRDASGSRLTNLPWALSIKDPFYTITTDKWPPKNIVGLKMMVSLLQALNYCAVALCTGARSSEILSATDGSLDSDNHRMKAKTFKLVDDISGATRDWPLHPVAVKALQIQQQIAQIVRAANDDHLWVIMQKGSEPAGSPLRNASAPLIHAAYVLGLDNHTGGGRAHAHRWRMTVARLVALAVASAPQVLMDLFGHRDLEMTIRYMLAHPNMAEEVMRIADEMAYAVAAEAIADTDAGLAGGPAASTIKRGLYEFKMRRGEEVLEAASMREAIEIFTFNGRNCQVVRPGVLCTKALGQFGPCTMGRGEADPGGCRTNCTHRLETARAKSHCELALNHLLNEHAAAAARDEEMTVANLEGQILANLMRWDDVRELIIERDEVAQRIWKSRLAA